MKRVTIKSGGLKCQGDYDVFSSTRLEQDVAGGQTEEIMASKRKR